MNSSIQWTHGITTSTTGLNMAWEAAGDEKGPVVLLIGGLGCQLTMWHDEFCKPLLDLGYRLIRFDNRDIGLTDQHPSSMRVNVQRTYIQKMMGKKVPTNYTLEQMADDALGLIDALNLDKPHLVGISMGGMIGQIMAAKGADKIGKLVTLMSSTNHHRLPGPTLKVFFNMFLRKPKSQKEDDVV
ncbi:MAG: alpha/beta hydrolase, partial [Limnobacter sp.]|nr:alpha/beta hydrolase [Limnobacter sp.]